MKEIIFKAIRKEDGKEIQGSLLQINERSYIYPHNWGDLEDVDFGRSFEEIEANTIERIQ